MEYDMNLRVKIQCYMYTAMIIEMYVSRVW